MDSPIEILLIDDDEDNYYSYKNIAAKNRVILNYASNLKDGIKLLKDKKKLMAVILDGKGFIEPTQQRGSEKEDFVHQALTELTVLEKEQDRYIPKCVLTAWYDKLLDSLESRVKIYDKKTVLPEEMFTYLKSEVYNSDLYKIRKHFNNVFEVINRCKLPIETDQQLFNALQKMKSGLPEKKDFTNLRDILESILKGINNQKKELLPDNLFNASGRPILEYCVRYLSGAPIGHNPQILYEKSALRVPEHIARSFEYVKEVTSIFSHNYRQKWDRYLFNSVLYSLFEIILWLDDEISQLTRL